MNFKLKLKSFKLHGWRMFAANTPPDLHHSHRLPRVHVHLCLCIDFLCNLLVQIAKFAFSVNAALYIFTLTH